MQEITIYKNYDCQTYNKRPMYSYHDPMPCAAYSEKMCVALPNDWKMHTVPRNITCEGKEPCDYIDMVESPQGTLYYLNNILGGNPDNGNTPCFALYDHGKIVRVDLELQ